MVKFRGKPRKKQGPHVAGETGVVQTYSAPNQFHLVLPFGKWRGLLPRTKRIILVFSAAIILVCLVFFAFSMRPDPNNGGLGRVYNENQAFKNQLKTAEENKPAENASSADKITYYKELSLYRANVGDYQGAIEAFNSAMDISAEAFDYFDYTRLAEYYHKTNNNTQAQHALTQAISVLPQKNDPDTGYVRSDVLAALEQMRKDYQQ
jgi:tetratricopeptide (TPR) repeat protein